MIIMCKYFDLALPPLFPTQRIHLFLDQKIRGNLRLQSGIRPARNHWLVGGCGTAAELSYANRMDPVPEIQPMPHLTHDRPCQDLRNSSMLCN